MKVIKNQDSYSVTLSEKEVFNLLDLVDLSPMIGAFDELREVFWKAKLNGQCEEKLKNWNYIPPSVD